MQDDSSRAQDASAPDRQPAGGRQPGDGTIQWELVVSPFRITNWLNPFVDPATGETRMRESLRVQKSFSRNNKIERSSLVLFSNDISLLARLLLQAEKELLSRSLKTHDDGGETRIS